jgi:hypothetical protein
VATIDTRFYKPRRSGLDSISAMGRNFGEIGKMMRQSKLDEMVMKQREFEFEQNQLKAKRDAEDRKRVEQERQREQARKDEFASQYQTMQMEGGEQLSPEQIQTAYANAYPEKYAEMQVKNALSRDPNAERRLKVMEDAEARKLAKAQTQMTQFEAKQKLELDKFKLSKDKTAEQVSQFAQQQALRREEMKLELQKPERERNFAQEGYRLQLPEYLQGKANPTRVYTQSDITKVKDANNSYGDIYKKVSDLQTLVPTASDYVDAKGLGETAGLVRSQVAQIITDYNRNVAELGALAGQDLTILEEAIPSPSQWKVMSFLTWKKTINNLKKNIKEKYQGLMRNSDINVSGNILDTIAKDSRVEADSGYTAGSTASSVASKYKKGNK